jgi:hypothetical protein
MELSESNSAERDSTTKVKDNNQRHRAEAKTETRDKI